MSLVLLGGHCFICHKNWKGSFNHKDCLDWSKSATPCNKNCSKKYTKGGDLRMGTKKGGKKGRKPKPNANDMK